MPGHISLSFSITGCGRQCKGCHSSYLQNKENGVELTKEIFEEFLDYYNDDISAVIFFGGDMFAEELKGFLQIAKARTLTTVLYSGFDSVDAILLPFIDYLKTGEYIEELGGLQSPNTNQKMVEVATGKQIYFYDVEGEHVIGKIN